jgi:RHS repeat-associated protein
MLGKNQPMTLQENSIQKDISILKLMALKITKYFKFSGSIIRWGYQSKVHDQSGLIYFGRRYYDPSSGRFITSDLEGYIDGPNLYAYTLNNPLTHHDPYGLFTEGFFDPDRWKEVGTAIYRGCPEVS